MGLGGYRCMVSRGGGGGVGRKKRLLHHKKSHDLHIYPQLSYAFLPPSNLIFPKPNLGWRLGGWLGCVLGVCVCVCVCVCVLLACLE